MFGKKKKLGKPKLDDGAKAAVLTEASGGAGPSGAGGQHGAAAAVGGAQLLSRALERYNLRMRRVCRAGAALSGIAVVLLLVGSLLTHFFEGYLRSKNWRRVPGISGIVLILFSLLVLSGGAALLVWAYHLLKNREKESEHRANLHAPKPGSLPTDAYPRQTLSGEESAVVASEAAPLQAKEPSVPHTDEVA